MTRLKGAGLLVVAGLLAGSCGTDDALTEPVAEPTTTTTTTLRSISTTLPLGSAEDALVCHSFTQTRLDTPTDQVMADNYVQTATGFLNSIDPRIPAVIATRWAEALAGPRALLVAYETAGRDFHAVDFDALEYQLDEDAVADLYDWCRRQGIEPGSPQPQQPPPPQPPRPDPPEECAGTYRFVYLDDDVTPDWIAPQENYDGSFYEDPIDWVVCDSEREEAWSFLGPGFHETFLSIDVDEDGVDDLVAIGGTTAYAFFGSLWVITGDEIVPLLTEDGAHAPLESSGWWEEKTTPTGWYGCGDLDGAGDGARRFASGTYDIVDGTVVAVGEEWTIEGDRIVGRSPFENRSPQSDDTFPGQRGCRSAWEVRAAAIGADPVMGQLNVRFTDARRNAVEVCADHLDPSTGAPTTVCAAVKYDFEEPFVSLGYRVELIEEEYFRDDAAVSLVQIDVAALPLRSGDTGIMVAHLQTGLQAFCLHLAEEVRAMRPGEEFPLSTPGQYDDVTEFMVRRFQAAQGLPVDGMYGRSTHDALLDEAVDNTPSNEGCFA